MTKYVCLSYMETRGVSSAILTTIHTDVVDQLAAIAKRPFDGSEIQDIEKEFVENIGGIFPTFRRNIRRTPD